MDGNVWETICSRLKDLLPPHVYHAYVERGTVDHIGEEKLAISFTDNFSLENFQEKCLPALSAVLKNLNLEAMHVDLQVSKPPEPDVPTYTYSQIEEAIAFDPKYSFDAFVVGNTNQFAHAACQAVAKHPGKTYNPLFIFGGAGLGKTHLIKAIGYEVSLFHKNLRVRYMTTESFTNELIQAIRIDKMREFREKYRSGCDLFLLDDVHFLAGKERTQEEFFYTFNYLHESRKQIVITSDRYPKDIPGLENRLQTRFQWGLVADIQPPELETRSAILASKAEAEQIVLPNDVAQFIASHVTSNIRELEGALHRLQAYATLTGATISIELAQQIFKDIAPRTRHEVTADGILKLVALHFNVRTIDLKSDKRARSLSFPRQICMYLLRKYLVLSFPEIGRFLGGKDHTTVLHGVTKIAQSLKKDPEVEKHLTEIEALIR